MQKPSWRCWSRAAPLSACAARPWTCCSTTCAGRGRVGGAEFVGGGAASGERRAATPPPTPRPPHPAQPELQAKIEGALLGSAAYARHGRGDARRLFRDAKQELEGELTREATLSLWAVLTQPPLAQQLEAAVQEAACRVRQQRQGGAAHGGGG